MGFMGIGWQEIMLILVGALVIFGPDRLPEVAGQVGKFMRDIRKMTSDLSGEFERNAGVNDIKKAVQSELAGIKGEIDGVTGTLQKEMNGVTKTVGGTVTQAQAMAKSSAAAATAKPSAGKPATTGKFTSSTTTTATKATAAKPATGTAAKPSVPVKPIASKVDPLADVSGMEDNQPVAAKPVAVSAASAQSSADTLDAINRARQRRMAAGYNKRPA